MRIIQAGMATLMLLLTTTASSEPLAKISAHIEKEHQIDIAVCKELSAEELRPCLKEAKDKKSAAYADAWTKRDPAQQTRVYYGDLNTNKPKIQKDYKADMTFCLALNKANAATCQREALARKKLAIRSIMIAPKEFKPFCLTCGTVTNVREVERSGHMASGIGSDADKKAKTSKVHEVTFKLNNGEEKTLSYSNEQNPFKTGDKIRFENNQLLPE